MVDIGSNMNETIRHTCPSSIRSREKEMRGDRGNFPEAGEMMASHI